MKDLLYKEFKLALGPTIFYFLLFSLLLIIPSWPFFIAFGYLFIGLNNVFFMGRSNRDIIFTASLPVCKRDTVRARVYSFACVEVLQILVAIPFAYLNTVINPLGNQAGMNLNVAFFGFVFAMYGVFNVIFFPRFYKTAFKIGAPILWAISAVLVYDMVVETLVHMVPLLKEQLNAFGTDHLLSQCIVLIGGTLLFSLLTRLSYRQSAKNFEKVDL